MIEVAEAGGGGDQQVEAGKTGAQTSTGDMPVSAAGRASSSTISHQRQQHFPPTELHAHPATLMIQPSAILQSIRDYCYLQSTIEMVLLPVLLFVVSILILSPRASFLRGFSLRRRRCTPDGHGQWGCCLEDDSEQGGVSSNRTITTNSTNNSHRDEDMISDEEQFEQLWPAIRTSAYRRLVLPPDCRLVDIPAFVKQQREEEQESKAKQEAAQNMAKSNSTDDDDHPLIRLKGYTDDLLHLLRNFLSYDYMEAGKMLIHWMQYWLRLKSRKTREVADDDEEEEEDDMSISTEGNNKRIERMDLSLLDDPQQNLHRRQSSASEYGSVMSQDESLEMASQQQQHHKPPLSPTRRLGRMASNGKKKDALATYRSSATTSSKLPVVVALNPTTISNNSSASSLPSTPKRIKPVAEVPIYPQMTTPRQEDFVLSDEYETTSPRTRIFSGSMSFFDTAHNKASLRRMHVEVPVPDRNGYILGDDFLPNTRHTPLLVFVNSRSGPRQGQVLIGQLRRLLNPIQIWDLADGNPERVLQSFCALTRLRIMVCGGDGTVSWIISCIEEMQLERWPPIAILPLGTGNDLARIHGWGGGYTNESLIEILEQVAASYISLLDRWEMKIETKKGKVKATKSFFNYVGFGADAQAALQVHMLRESKPQLFFSRLFNKIWYFVFGAEEAIKESNINLPNEIVVIADGVEVPLPPDSQGIIMLNIDSYSGGVPVWSHGDNGNLCYISNNDMNDSASIDGVMPDREPVGIHGQISPRRVRSMGHISLRNRGTFDRVDSVDDFLADEPEEDKYRQIFSCDRPSSCQDGKLDIVSVRGTFHLGQIQVGLSNATKLCQASEVKIILKKKVAVQIDGEPWRQSASTITITRKKDQAVMLHRSADESGGVETEMAKLLDWAEDRSIIDRNVHSVLMKEFSRRIESKTRQRRVRSQDNLMLTLKRAIASGGGQTSAQPAFPGTLSF